MYSNGPLHPAGQPEQSAGGRYGHKPATQTSGQIVTNVLADATDIVRLLCIKKTLKMASSFS